jgi:hypothetical protein
MFDGRFRLAASVALVLAGLTAGPHTRAADQTPRQAMIEMFTGGEALFKKHLTVEMQSRLANLMKGSLDNAPNPLQVLAGPDTSGSDKMQAFEQGAILFAINNSQEHERYEIQIYTEEARGDNHIMGLSLHLVRGGVEQEMPGALRFVLELKRQEGIWRLNAITVSATLPVGDPRILERSWWSPALSTATGGAVDPANPPVLVEDRPRMSPLRAVRMIGMAENIYAQKHPGLGYTCSMADLVNVGRGMDEEGMYKFMDAEFADGVYNGYRYSLSGCENKPARIFHVIAEPVAGRGKAYCSDNTNNLRTSDDGRGTTCLISGKLARK